MKPAENVTGQFSTTYAIERWCRFVVRLEADWLWTVAIVIPCKFAHVL